MEDSGPLVLGAIIMVVVAVLLLSKMRSAPAKKAFVSKKDKKSANKALDKSATEVRELQSSCCVCQPPLKRCAAHARAFAFLAIFKAL